MTDCNMCGNCCENIGLSVDLPRIKSWLASPIFAGKRRKDAQFLANNMIPNGMVERRGGRVKVLYDCAKFDKVTRACTAHNDRPEMCKGYPWYGREPEQGDTTMGAQCSFLADAYKMLPIVGVTNGRVY